MSKKSLKARLTLHIVIPVMLALLVIGGIGSYSAYNEAEKIYDTELSHVADLMLAILSAEDKEEARHSGSLRNHKDITHDIVELGSNFEETGQSYEKKLAFRIWKSGKLLFYSEQSSGFGEERVTAGFSNQEIDGKEWRFYVLPDTKAGYTIEMAQRLQIRTMLIMEVMTTIFSPLILLIPIILIITWAGLRAGLKTLMTISDAVKHRSSLDLTPLPEFESIAEITPLIDSINGLLENLDYALKKEKRFTDFAAHELRTPIAIFKTQAQTALKATDDTQRKTILEAQVKAADRATGMVDQLLTLARLEHADIPTEKLSLGEIAKMVLQERLPLAEQKSLNMLFEERNSAFVNCNKEMLTIILSNLVGNAIKYTPPNGNVIVTLSIDNKLANLAVRDSGPGIPEEKLPYITERFYRVSNHSQPGAGLGLTIAKRASEIMGANLILQNNANDHGFESILQFHNYTAS